VALVEYIRRVPHINQNLVNLAGYHRLRDGGHFV
jgi:hypothetical protein